jgi:hypothetical protein
MVQESPSILRLLELVQIRDVWGVMFELVESKMVLTIFVNRNSATVFIRKKIDWNIDPDCFLYQIFLEFPPILSRHQKNSVCWKRSDCGRHRRRHRHFPLHVILWQQHVVRRRRYDRLLVLLLVVYWWFWWW